MTQSRLSSALCCALLLVSLGQMAHAADGGAGSRKDPTLPPPAWLAIQSGQAVVAANTDLPDLANARVDLLLVGKSRKIALVDGQFLRPGDTYNGAKLVTIRAAKVVFDDPGKTISIAPGVEKRQPGRRSASVGAKRVLVVADKVDRKGSGS